MTAMDKRKAAALNKFAIDEELSFKAFARRNKMLALWAAKLQNIAKNDTDSYIKEVIHSDFDEPGDEDVFRKIKADFEKNNVSQSDHQLRRKMDELLEEAKIEIIEEM